MPKPPATWIMGEVSRKIKELGVGIGALSVSSASLAGLIRLVDAGTISSSAAKTVFARMCDTGESAEAVVQSEGLAQIDDAEALATIVTVVIEANPHAVASYRDGKASTLGFLVGQVMRETRGKANPRMVNELVKRALDG